MTEPNKWEYKTTVGKRGGGVGYDWTDDPKPPPGSGWEMCGSAIYERTFFWFWRKASPAWEDYMHEQTKDLFK